MLDGCFIFRRKAQRIERAALRRKLVIPTVFRDLGLGVAEVQMEQRRRRRLQELRREDPGREVLSGVRRAGEREARLPAVRA